MTLAKKKVGLGRHRVHFAPRCCRTTKIGCNIVLWEFYGGRTPRSYRSGLAAKSISTIAGSSHFSPRLDISISCSAFSRTGTETSVSTTCAGLKARAVRMGFNRFEYIGDSQDLKTIEEKINAVMGGKYPSEVFAARVVVTRILPPPASPCGQPECGTESSAVGKE